MPVSKLKGDEILIKMLIILAFNWFCNIEDCFTHKIE